MQQLISKKMLAGLTLISAISINNSAVAEEACGAAYAIDSTLPNGGRWTLCWEHSLQNGISLHHIAYQPKNGSKQDILYRAELAQVHVPYDDNGARYHDISDYGFGDRNMLGLDEKECPNGSLISYAGKSVICQQVLPRGEELRYQDKSVQGYKLSLFSISQIGSYNYVPRWEFFDNGTIELSVGATGALQRFTAGSQSNQGWPIADNKIGLAHLHNFFWRLDFDLAGNGANDMIEEINFVRDDGGLKAKKEPILVETGRDVNPQTMRTWIVADKTLKNAADSPIAYEIQLYQAGQRDVGPEEEAFTKYDIYFTKAKECERFASHNSNADVCAKDLSTYINDESLEDDIIVWPTTTFYHIPRAEDAPNMNVHWSGIRLKPFDWHNSNPLAGTIR
ncbi:hypothetical protein [uncultured Thiothrix sp.]|uniref:copper amine oxidase n=1 Tax=uncultured Thiothrix sp. TaxID=223185 RepID=UPI0026376CAB|nr:hypothetical protein [uncultured Thiothrix sp.]